MRCPTCDMEFDHQFDLRQGTHVEYRCPCGQLLQWDYLLQSIRPAALRVGSPQPCRHPDFLKPHALFPSHGPLTT